MAEFVDPWEARLASDSLGDAGIEAWLEGSGPDRAITGERSGRIRLVVRREDVEDARELLAALEPTEPQARRPAWVPVVAAVVAIGLIWTAVPRFLWPWILFGGLIGFLLWRAAGPRRP